MLPIEHATFVGLTTNVMTPGPNHQIAWQQPHSLCVCMINVNNRINRTIETKILATQM